MWRLYGDYYNIWRSLYGMDQHMDIGDQKLIKPRWMDIQRSFFHVEPPVSWPHPTPNTPSHCHHCHWIGYRSYAMASWCFMNRILDPKNIQKIWYFDELVKSCFMGFLEMLGRNCMSFPAISPANPSGHFKARDRRFWRNTWHRRSWTSHMSTMRRPSLCDLFGAETFWWLIGNQPYMEVLSNGHISWDNIGVNSLDFWVCYLFSRKWSRPIIGYDVYIYRLLLIWFAWSLVTLHVHWIVNS